MDNNMNNELQEPITQVENQKKGFHHICAAALMYVLSIYLVPIIVSAFLTLVDKDMIVYSLFLIPVILGIVNIIVSVKCCKPGNRIMLLNAAVLVKYSLIPFFIFNGFASALFLLLTFSPVPFMIFVAPGASVMLWIVGWFVMALGMPYTISYLCVSAREKLRSKGMVIIHSLTQFFFVVDVIDVMVLTMKEHKWKKLTITVMILLAILTLLLLVLLVSEVMRIIKS
ncbi:MAG: hypothetical protein NC347_08830 [Clostridium sp.]|nr:hypothetical protein [Clostridium sp.]